MILENAQRVQENEQRRSSSPNAGNVSIEVEQKDEKVEKPGEKSIPFSASSASLQMYEFYIVFLYPQNQKI